MGYIYDLEELYLAHHGIKGQKWGIRRYQNEDGTLTPAGKARYGVESVRSNSNKIVRKLVTSDYAGIPGFLMNPNYTRSRREDRLERRVEKIKNQMPDAKNPKRLQKKLESKERKLNAQKQYNINKEKYDANLSTGYRALQTFLPVIGPVLHYNDMLKAQNFKSNEALVRTVLATLPLTAIPASIINAYDIKKQYGAKFWDIHRYGW